jgi:hypothetical protein
MVDDFLFRAEHVPPPGRLAALIAPHAGYVYSGSTAAWALEQLRGSGVKTVILLGSAHRVGFDGVAVYDGDGWMTPLGAVPVDRGLVAEIMARDERFRVNNLAHQAEHSLEVELPFLQRVLDDFKIVPVLTGRMSEGAVRALGEALAAVLAQRKDAVVVCSTDLSHYPAYDAARLIDRETLQAIESLDAARLLATARKHLQSGVPGLATLVCAQDAVLATMHAVGSHGNPEARVLSYANSGDVIHGDRGRVVGYGAVAFWWKEEEMNIQEKTSDGLSPVAERRLLQIAREALFAAAHGQPPPSYPAADKELQRHQGAFVTLHKDGALRGCIGQFVADQPLYQVVREMALASALHDSRFSPVTPEELDRIKIEISVLSPLRRVNNPLKEVKLGTHGIYIKRGGRTGTYLPQVAVEHGMGLEEFLSSCSAHKAGLSPDAWRAPGTEVYVYTASVIEEK